jgi:hypothetical protein
MRGEKVVEYRSRQTFVRGRILIYAALGRYDAETECSLLLEYAIDEMAASLPRGFVVGSVELYDCLAAGDGYEWCLRGPVRFREPLSPARHPQPVWFRPFE